LLSDVFISLNDICHILFVLIKVGSVREYAIKLMLNQTFKLERSKRCNHVHTKWSKRDLKLSRDLKNIIMMLSNTRQLKITKFLYVYKPVISLRYVSNDIQGTAKINSDIQEQPITDQNINSILSQTDSLNAWGNFFTNVPQNDASNSKLSGQDLKRYSKKIVKEEKEKHILKGNIEMEINQGVNPKEEQSQSKHINYSNQHS
jgi:hypothetical protein